MKLKQLEQRLTIYRNKKRYIGAKGPDLSGLNVEIETQNFFMLQLSIEEAETNLNESKINREIGSRDNNRSCQVYLTFTLNYTPPNLSHQEMSAYQWYLDWLLRL